MPRYRGYEVEFKFTGGCWRVSVHPKRLDVPILSNHTFDAPLLPEGAAWSEVKRRIDRALE
jgi:hypothetical protein